jgi:AraC family transcriptional regulator, regulatory protein of adaptative response / methylated-DNA-[protein]-cysteine methyltransferase
MREEAGEISNAAWQAVVKKDRQYDGKFVYAAVTTGIYCRPSCPARNPQRRNALIFLTAAEAEREGYTACLRCHPNSLTPAEKGIKAALDYIEAHMDQAITLNTLSQVAGLSPHHMQETFKRIVGLSPKAFCDARRIARFKQYLRAGQSISSACYEVGYGSSRALYEKTRKGMGMTPAVYQRGGKGVRVSYSIIESAFGNVLVGGTEQGLCAVLLGEDGDAVLRELRQEFPRAVLKRESSTSWAAAVLACQHEDPLFAKLPASLRGRVFQARVWVALQRRRTTQPQ